MQLGKKLEWDFWDREMAIIVTNDGKWYEDYCHQYCLIEIQQEFADICNLDNEKDFAKLISYTDYEFKQGRLHGFDLFQDDDGQSYLISHYKKAFENSTVLNVISNKCKENGWLLGTFVDETKLGNDAYLIVA